MDQTQIDYLKGAVEALLFVSDKPVTSDQIKDAIPGVQPHEIKDILAVLKKDYETAGRGMVVVEIANGWQMLSSANYANYIREFYKTRHKEKLSRPALETLAIIAYKQPVSRTDVEVIRGVNSDGVVMHLLNKGLIKITGRKEVPGRPYVYGTTAQFLEYFGLRSLEDLPKLEEFPALAAKENSAQPTVNPDAGLVSGALPAGEPASSAAGVEADPVIREELAQARTRLDIEELERKIEVSPEFMEPAIEGETSGQSRLLSQGDRDPGAENTTE